MVFLGATDPTGDELAVADEVHDVLRRRFDRTLGYSRVDLLAGGAEGPLVLEVELIDPNLSLPLRPSAVNEWAMRLRAAIEDDSAVGHHGLVRKPTRSTEEVAIAAADRVKADIERTTGLPWDYELRREAGGSYACYQPTGGVIPHIMPGESVEEAAVEIADCHSGELAEHLAGQHRLDEARVWPRCPRHDHAMDPDLVDGLAFWVCRSDGTIRVRIGDLQ